MSESAELHALQREVARFRDWAFAKYGDNPWARNGSWEMQYAHWDDLYGAFKAFIAAIPFHEWDQIATDAVLYVVARDHESNNYKGNLVRYLAETPSDFVRLAERAVECPERDARWQIAKALAALEPRPPNVEPLLLQFAHDEDEYVRRRALTALASIGSPAVEDLAEAEWQTGEEYARIGAICALGIFDSPRLIEFAERAEADDQPFLAGYVAYIREHGTLRGYAIQGLPVV